MHTWLLYSYMLRFFSEPPSLVNYLIYITSFMPKTMDFCMLSSTDNRVSVTQLHQGIRCQEALFMKKDIWIQDVYSASDEVQWGQEMALSYSLCFAAQRAQNRSKRQPAWVKLITCHVLFAEIQGQKYLGPTALRKSTQAGKNPNWDSRNISSSEWNLVGWILGKKIQLCLCICALSTVTKFFCSAIFQTMQPLSYLLNLNQARKWGKWSSQSW